MTRASLVSTISKDHATPTLLEAFKARSNKKDSFTRWYQKFGSM